MRRNKVIDYYLQGLFFIQLLHTSLSGGCTFFPYEKTARGLLLCSGVTSDQYVSSVIDSRLAMQDILQNSNAKLSIYIDSSNIGDIKSWISEPWLVLDNNPYSFRFSASVDRVTVVNSSVKSVDGYSLSIFSGLSTLDLSGNNILDYSFLNNIPNLHNLYLTSSDFSSYNKSFLYSFNTNNLKVLNLSNSKNLDSFQCCGVGGNLWLLNIQLVLNNIIGLKTLNLYGYSQLDLDISGDNSITNIKYINEIDSLKATNMGGFNFSILNGFNIKSLTVSDNTISAIGDSGFQLKKINQLSNVYISNSKLGSITGDYFLNFPLNDLDLSQNNLKTLSSNTFKGAQIKNLNLSHSNIESIDNSVFIGAYISTLDLSGNNLKSIDTVCQANGYINELDLSFNPITSLNSKSFGNCISLTKLNLTNNYDTTIDTDALLSLINLNQLEISFRDPSILHSIRNHYLENLYIRNSNISLDAPYFQGLDNLRYLGFPGSIISNISSQVFEGLFNIEEIDTRNLFLYSGYKPVFRNLSSLIRLDLSNYQIKNFDSKDLMGLTHLQFLNLSSNLITTLKMNDFLDLNNLNSLILSHNKIASISFDIFAPLKNLKNLYLDHNQIYLDSGYVTGLNGLVALDLSFNPLFSHNNYSLNAYLPHRNLETLMLESTSVKYEKLSPSTYVFPRLTRIEINNNAGNCEDLAQVLDEFSARNIMYTPTNPRFNKSNIEGIICSSQPQKPSTSNAVRASLLGGSLAIYCFFLITRIVFN